MQCFDGEQYRYLETLLLDQCTIIVSVWSAILGDNFHEFKLHDDFVVVQSRKALNDCIPWLIALLVAETRCASSIDDFEAGLCSTAASNIVPAVSTASKRVCVAQGWLTFLALASTRKFLARDRLVGNKATKKLVLLSQTSFSRLEIAGRLKS